MVADMFEIISIRPKLKGLLCQKQREKVLHDQCEETASTYQVKKVFLHFVKIPYTSQIWGPAPFKQQEENREAANAS